MRKEFWYLMWAWGGFILGMLFCIWMRELTVEVPKVVSNNKGNVWTSTSTFSVPSHPSEIAHRKVDCVVEVSESEIPVTRWIGCLVTNSYNKDKYTPSDQFSPGVMIGIRSDGNVVWKMIKENAEGK